MAWQLENHHLALAHMLCSVRHGGQSLFLRRDFFLLQVALHPQQREALVELLAASTCQDVHRLEALWGFFRMGKTLRMMKGGWAPYDECLSLTFLALSAAHVCTKLPADAQVLLCCHTWCA